MDMDWESLKTILAIARSGSLSAAARELQLTQPTVGRRLDALERSTGRTLFQRTRSGFIPTETGADLLAYAGRMEHEAIAAARRLAGQDEALSGLLRITSSDWFGHRVLAPQFGSFLLRHPGLSLELLTDTRWYSLERREADIAFRFVPFGSPDVVQRRVLNVEYGVYASADYLAQHGLPRKGAGKGHRVVGMDRAFQHMADVVWLAAQLPDAHTAAQSNSREVQCRICRDGAGIAVLPRILGDAEPGLLPVDTLGAPPRRDVWMGYHRDLRDMRRLRALVAHLDGVFGALELP